MRPGGREGCAHERGPGLSQVRADQAAGGEALRLRGADRHDVFPGLPEVVLVDLEVRARDVPGDAVLTNLVETAIPLRGAVEHPQQGAWLWARESELHDDFLREAHALVHARPVDTARVLGRDPLQGRTLEHA